ncbi:FIST signal transduction protein [Planktosalinus lacus]|uniref:Histidine kinase n=1 Tax=Planktosalinus lacus TaxID=1526573 RepID=A0A8J2VF98_9FLAO|nr:FIST N-terminal domain-containing protein [Planktosalinus lacus]GGE01348.1 hypothetical protein GCM10011312_26010 [Planktosalinus lacus]
MKAKTIKEESPEDIKTALAKSIDDDFKPTLAIVFMSFKKDINAVCELLNDEGIQIFGATSAGEFIDSEIEDESIVIMLLDINPSYFKIMFLEAGEHSEFEIAKQLGVEGKKTFANAAFIIASGWSNEIDGEEVINGIENGFGGGATIFGGMAGDDLTLTGPKAFTHGKSSVTGLVALILDQDKVEVSGVATCGWKPIGITKTVTKSEGNVVYTIDDKPALDLVAKYLGLNLDKKFNNTVFDLGGYYPLQLEREGAPPVMRTAQMGNIENRSLICAGNVPQGSKVRFSLPPDFDVIDTVVEECNEVKSEQLQEADAVIMFSCISRYLSFGVMTSEEIKRVKEVWNAPLVGFFTYGEYGKAKGGQHEFHNNTCCVVALKEK